MDSITCIYCRVSAPAGQICTEKAVADQRFSNSDTNVNGTNDLLEHVQWQLEWKFNMQPHNVPKENRNISLILKCIPKPEYTSKMGDVWVTIGFTLYSGEPSNGNVIREVPSSSVQPIKLTKAAQYQCVLIRDYGMPLTFTAPSARSYPYPQNIQLNAFAGSTHIGAEIVIINMGCPLSDTLRNDLGALLSFDSSESQNKFSDVKLVASLKENGSSMPVEFPAHKLILAARSPVFARMFEHSMLESTRNKVQVDDIHPDILKVMLIYMYTGQVPWIKDQNMAFDLLYAADKYQLDHLKSLCEQHIISSLQVNNAAHIVQFAHLHNAPELKRITLQFISKHAAAVRATKEWKEVIQCPEILDELIQTMHTMRVSVQ